MKQTRFVALLLLKLPYVTFTENNVCIFAESVATSQKEADNLKKPIGLLSSTEIHQSEPAGGP